MKDGTEEYSYKSFIQVGEINPDIEEIVAIRSRFTQEGVDRNREVDGCFLLIR